MAITRVKASSVTQGLPKRKTALAGNDVILPGSYEYIDKVDVGAGGAAAIDFTSIPSTYKHLQIRWIGRDTRAAVGQNTYFQFNGDTAANYSWHLLRGTATSSLSTGSSGASIMLMDNVSANGLSNTFAVGIIDILDYANTNKYKTVRVLNGYDQNGTDQVIDLWSGSWRNTAAINRIYFYPNSGTFSQYTQYALYGIK